MLGIPKLSPEEKSKLERLITNVQRTSRARKPTDSQRWFMKHQLRVILMMLGEPKRPELDLRNKALKIINDGWPFKIYRLRKLIKNGRRG
jgi:hypothetical protein